MSSRTRRIRAAFHCALGAAAIVAALIPANAVSQTTVVRAVVGDQVGFAPGGGGSTVPVTVTTERRGDVEIVTVIPRG